MKKIIIALFCSLPIFASVHVTAAYPYIGELAKTIARDKAEVSVIAQASSDPHFVTPRPSYIGILRNSDLLVLNGGDLEIGWIPPLLAQSNNPKIIQGASGYLDLSKYIKLIDKPTNLSRAGGDVHGDGNPHYSLDPHNMLTLAKVIMLKLSNLDPANKNSYHANYDAFAARWSEKLAQWDGKMEPCKNSKLIQHHELFNYFLNRYSISTVSTIEPLPGISPNSKHSMELINLIKSEKIKLIIQDDYHETKSAQFIADKSGAKVVVLPHDVGSLQNTGSLEALFDTIVAKICQQ